MAKYNANNIGLLADKIREKSTVVNKAASLSLNKTSTFTVLKSIEAITDKVNLQESYVKKHIKTSARASPANLRTIIQASDKGTLLDRYHYTVMKKGIKVAVNKGTGFRYLRNAFLVSGLRNSSTTGIAVRNRDAVEYFKNALSKGERTAKKSRKLQHLIAKAHDKPNGIEVLHSRSINQLFTSVRTDIADNIQGFLLAEFLIQLERLNK